MGIAKYIFLEIDSGSTQQSVDRIGWLFQSHPWKTGRIVSLSPLRGHLINDEVSKAFEGKHPATPPSLQKYGI